MIDLEKEEHAGRERPAIFSNSHRILHCKNMAHVMG